MVSTTTPFIGLLLMLIRGLVAGAGSPVALIRAVTTVGLAVVQPPFPLG
ncbi:MAG TPA: hypothetical protein VFC00_40330 [Micromonosporaceae bacterium]|nr:hypothetical protein [Micromonosporaceae bacterium]